METKFFKCNVCQNLVMKIHDSGLDMQCCGRDMEYQEPQMDEEQLMGEKHVPVCTVKGNKLHVKVGSEPHPSTKEHYIDWIYVQTDRGGYLRYLKAEDAPEICLRLSKHDCVEKVFIHCNIHGLWACDCNCVPQEDFEEQMNQKKCC